jgi:hypothetical protein
MRLSQACVHRVLLRKQCEDAENLLNSNDTRRFIGMENSNIVKILQNVIQYQALSNIKRVSFIVQKKLDSRQIGTLIGTLQFPSFDFPDHKSESIQLKVIFEFDKIDKYEIISPLDLNNVWVEINRLVPYVCGEEIRTIKILNTKRLMVN